MKKRWNLPWFFTHLRRISNALDKTGISSRKEFCCICFVTDWKHEFQSALT
jgi:hypothetical protein